MSNSDKINDGLFFFFMIDCRAYSKASNTHGIGYAFVSVFYDDVYSNFLN